MSQDISARISLFFRGLIQNPYIVVGSMTLFGASLRLYHLGYKSLWLDEAVLYWISQGNIGDVIAQNAARNSAPFLFALLINLVSALNETEFFLRGIPWLAGVASIPAMYLFSKKILPKYSAYFVTFIVTIALTPIVYSQQLREYSIAFLLAALILATFYTFLREPNWKHLGLMTLAWVFGIFSQYGLAILILSLNIVFAIDWILSKDRNVKVIAKWIVAQILVLGAVAVVYQLSLKDQIRIGFGATSTTNYLAGAYWDGSLSSLIRMVINNTLGYFSFAYPASYLMLFVCFVGVLFVLQARKWTVLSQCFFFRWYVHLPPQLLDFILIMVIGRLFFYCQ